jgi:hypothetical protein
MENTTLLPVSVHGHHVMALLESGSTTNFINANLMRRLQLATTPHPTLRVSVANRDRVLCQDMVRDVALIIGMEEFSIRCYGISLSEFDLILGVEFLHTLGAILWDFEALSVAFMRGPRCVLWTGISSSRDDIWEPVTRAVTSSPGQPLLDRLLHHFMAMFEEP